MNQNNLGIYIHIPFCNKKCNYCDFLTMIGYNKDRIDRYVDYISSEIKIMKNYGEQKNVDTIYFGGGTPSLLSEKNIFKIINTINKNFSVNKNAEITIEINPETIDEIWIKKISEIGINRASIGFQNSDDNILRLIGRNGDLKSFINCVSYLKKYNINNLSADIILALPNMNVEKTLKDAKILADLNLSHISAYSLILEEKTKLFLQVKKGEIKLPDEDLEREIYHEFNKYIVSRDYHRYEVSSFCKKGYESKHNSKYWDLSEYLGLGIGASGLINKTRTKNPLSLKDYYKKIDECEEPFNVEYKMTLNDMMSEYSFLSIRTSMGIDKEKFKNKFGRDFHEVFNLNIHIQNGLILEDNKYIKLTDKGFDLSNIVEVDLII